MRVQRLSPVGGADGLGQVLNGGRLAQEPVGPCLDRPAERQLIVEPVRTTTAVSFETPRIRRDVSSPSMPGIWRSTSATSGCSGLGLVGRALAVPGDHDHLEVVFLVEGHGERLTERSVVVDDDDGDAGFVGIHPVES